MRRHFFVWLTAAILMTSVLTLGEAQKRSFKVEMKNAQGDSVGTATISPAGRGVRITLDLKNLPPACNSYSSNG